MIMLARTWIVLTSLTLGAQTVAQEDCDSTEEQRRLAGHLGRALAVDVEQPMERARSTGAVICFVHEFAGLVGADTTAWDAVGRSVALSDGLALLGSWSGNRGSGYFFRRTAGGGWQEEQKVEAPPNITNPPCYFAEALALDGNVAVIGDWQAGPFCSGPGLATPFRFDGDGWKSEIGIYGWGNSYGYSVAVRGNALAIGATGVSTCPVVPSTAGFVEYRTFGGSTWQAVGPPIRGSDTVRGDSFAESIALSDDGSTLVVGAAYADLPAGADAGAVYVFSREGTLWTEDRKLTAVDPQLDDRFGISVAIEGNVIAVGASHDDVGVANAGSVYLFQNSGEGWAQTQNFASHQPTNAGLFGTSVSLDGGHLAVGEPGVTRNVVHLYREQAGVFRFVHQMNPRSNKPSSQAGAAVSLDGKVCLVGAPQEDYVANRSGVGYLFEVQELGLGTDGTLASAGDTVTLTVCGGVPGTPSLVALVNRNGVPGFGVFGGMRGVFDSEGRSTSSFVVPFGLAGKTLRFQAFGQYLPGVGGSSRVVDVNTA